MPPHHAPTAARGVLFAVTPLPWLRQALRTTATPRFWVRSLRGATGKRVPNKPPNDVAIIQTPSLSGLRLNTKCAMLATDDTMMNAWFAIELVCRLRWFSLDVSLVVMMQMMLMMPKTT